MSFDKQPTLSGERLSLRPLLRDDFQPLYAAAADPLIWEQHPDKNRYQEKVFREFFAAAIESRGALLVTDTLTGDVIGSSRFHAYSAENRSIEIGWTFLTRNYWGGAYNAELKALMLSHAFESVDTVMFLIGSKNIRSQEATKKLGAVQMDIKTSETNNTNLVFELTHENYINRYKSDI